MLGDRTIMSLGYSFSKRRLPVLTSLAGQRFLGLSRQSGSINLKQRSGRPRIRAKEDVEMANNNVTLGALGLPFGKTTVMHLVPRETLPEPNSQGNNY
ncbi:hypothetical protein NQ318_017688 [Aromia moschata]|uniref:UBL3-like ubiquitin domain-containing protein n=1 Tax=Aromia moschata TaxID=1265417 RepID=A0AAV8XZ61_9CUCU|nr:hypothetical protein NQ318_017688 [Aromia moschata]